VHGARPEEGDAGGEDEPERKPHHRDPSLTRKPRISLTEYGREASVVRDGSVPLASIGPRAANEIRQTMTASISYPLEPQLASTYGLRPWSPGRQRVSYSCTIASAGGGPARYGVPAPPATPAPSPNRHSTRSGSATTVTVSPASETVSSSDLGPGSSQNHESVPVKPAATGDVLMRPGNSDRRSATDAAIATGSMPGPPGPTSV